jgi:hypothetical protein
MPISRRALGYRTWKDYAWDAETWAAIRNGKLPDGETYPSVLIAAYLAWMHEEHGTTKQVQSVEILGKLGEYAKWCLGSFTACADEDGIAGLRDALNYVWWYVTQEMDTWFIKKNRPVTLCFHPSAFRDAYGAALYQEEHGYHG